MENFGEKMGRKIFLMGVWLEEGEGKKLVGRRCFLSGLTKMCSTKWAEFFFFFGDFFSLDMIFFF